MNPNPNADFHLFWQCGDYDWDNSMMSTGKAGARMYRLHDQITVEAVHYDHEDNREYYSQGKFSIESYKKAFQEMETAGNSVVEGSRDRLTMKRVGEFVELKLSGVPSPSNTPGGTQLSSTCDFGKISIDTLRLRSREKGTE